MSAANSSMVFAAASSSVTSVASLGADIPDGVSAEHQRVLEYPRDFFNGNGNVWDNQWDICRFWCYRKDRRFDTFDGNADPERCNHEQMKVEMIGIRKSLRDFIMQRYLEGIRNAVSDYDGLRMPLTHSHPVTEADMKAVLGKLKRTPENEMMVYCAFQKFHKDRSWLSTEIDIWLSRENMRLMDVAKGTQQGTGKNKVKEFRHSRGSFSRVAANAKGQGVAALMDFMLIKAGWCVSLAKKASKGKRFEKREAANGKDFFYIVTTIKDAPSGTQSTNEVIVLLSCAYVRNS